MNPNWINWAPDWRACMKGNNENFYVPYLFVPCINPVPLFLIHVPFRRSSNAFVKSERLDWTNRTTSWRAWWTRTRGWRWRRGSTGTKSSTPGTAPFIMQGGFFIRTYIECTICQISSDPFYVVTYYMKCVTTSWTHSMKHSKHIKYG